MSVLVRLIAENLKKYYKEAFMVIVSIALTVSMMTLIAALGWGVFRGVSDLFVGDVKESVVINNVVSSQELLHAIGSDVVLGYTHGASHCITVPDVDSNGETYNRYLTCGQSTSNLKNIIEANNDSIGFQGRFPTNSHEVVINDTETMYNIGDIIDAQYSTWDSKTGVETHLPHRVEVVGKSKTYGFSWFHVSEDQLHNLEQDGVDMNVYFKDGVGNIEGRVEKAIANSRDAFLSGEPATYWYSETYNYFKGFQSRPPEVVGGSIVILVVLLVLVCITTYSLIHNAFAAILNQKRGQFGLLRSVGTTKSQLRCMLLLEGFLYGAIGILSGLMMGLGLSNVIIERLNSVLVRIGAYTMDSWRYAKIPNGVSFWILAFITLLGNVVMFIASTATARSFFKGSSVETIRKKKVRTKKIMILKPRRSLAFSLSRIYAKMMKSYRGISIALFVSSILVITSTSISEIVSDIMSKEVEIYDTVVTKSLFDVKSSDFEDERNALKHLIAPYSETLGIQKTSSYQSTYPRELNHAFSDVKTVQDYPDSIHGASLFIVEDATYQELLNYSSNKPTLKQSALFYNHKQLRMSGTYYSGKIFDIDGSTTIAINNPELINTAFEFELVDVGKQLPAEYKHLMPQNDSGLYLVVSLSSYLELFKPVDTIDFMSTTFLIQSANSSQLYHELKQDTNDLDLYHVSSNKEVVEIGELALETAEFIVFTLVGFIVLVVLFSILNIGIINNQTRKQENAALQTIGATKNQVILVVVWESAIAIGCSIFLGICAGLLISFGIYQYLVYSIPSKSFIFGLNLRGIAFCIGYGLFAILLHYALLKFSNSQTTMIEDLRRDH